jgi:hypothetical protein
MNKPLKGVGYDLNSTNKGFSFAVHGPDYSEPGDNLMLGLNLPPPPDIPILPTPDFPVAVDKIEQFECRVTPFGGMQYLQIAKGSVTYSQSNMPLIKSSPKVINKQCYINKAAVYEEVTEMEYTDPESPWMLNGGGYLLGGTGTWIVALCKWDIVSTGFDGTGLTMPALLAEQRPFLVIYKQGGTLAQKINSETGPSLYSNETNDQKMSGYNSEDTTLSGDFGYCHTTWFNPRKLGYSMRTIAIIESGVPDNIAPTVTRIQAANPATKTNEIHRLNVNTIPKAGNFKLNYTDSITGNSDPFDPLFGGEFELGIALSAITALQGNIAVQQYSADAYDIVYANALQAEAITLPTIANNTLTYFNETYVVTQCAVGSQDIVIELNFNGTVFKNIKGLTEANDPYNISLENDWNGIVNINDILLFDGIEENLDWYTDISIAPTTATQVTYTIPDSCIPENPPQFECRVIKTVVDDANVFRLKVVKGEVPFTWDATDGGELQSGLQPLFNSIYKFNLFPSGSKTDGATGTSPFVNQDGYITLEAEQNYVVFIYMLGPFYEVELGAGEFTVPQLAVSKIIDDPHTDITNGTIAGREFAVISSIYLNIAVPEATVSYHYKNTFSLRANIARIKWNEITLEFDVEQITNFPTLNYVPININGNQAFDSTTVNSIVDGYSGYTKDLNDQVTGYNVIEQGQL